MYSASTTWIARHISSRSLPVNDSYVPACRTSRIRISGNQVCGRQPASWSCSEDLLFFLFNYCSCLFSSLAKTYMEDLWSCWWCRGIQPSGLPFPSATPCHLTLLNSTTATNGVARPLALSCFCLLLPMLPRWTQGLDEGLEMYRSSVVFSTAAGYEMKSFGEVARNDCRKSLGYSGWSKHFSSLPRLHTLGHFLPPLSHNFTLLEGETLEHHFRRYLSPKSYSSSFGSTCWSRRRWAHLLRNHRSMCLMALQPHE